MSAHASSSEHGQTSVAQLLGLHVGKSLGISRLQAKGIKSKVSGVVLFTKSEKSSEAGLDPTSVGAKSFGNINGQEEGEQNCSGNVRDHVVGNDGVIKAVRDRGSVLGKEVSNNGLREDAETKTELV